MKKFLFGLLLCLITVQAYGATAPVNDVLNLGGPSSGSNPGIIVPTNSDQVVDLMTGASVSSQDYFYRFASGYSTATGTYQVPAGKKLVCNGLYMSSDTTVNTMDYVQFGWSPANLGVDALSTAPPSAVCYATSCSNGPSTRAPGSIPVISNGFASVETFVPVSPRWDSLEYPFMRFGASSHIFMARLKCLEQTK